MRRTQARHVSARIQSESGRRLWRPRQRGPPVRTFCDLTKRPLHDPISARTGGKSSLPACRETDIELRTIHQFQREIEHAAKHTLHFVLPMLLAGFVMAAPAAHCGHP